MKVRKCENNSPIKTTFVMAKNEHAHYSILICIGDKYVHGVAKLRRCPTYI